MILGMGVDAVSNGRLKALLERWEDRFSGRVFTPGELAYARERGKPHLHLAARFAAKEAFLKALGTGLREGLALHEVEVVNDPLGKPSLLLQGRSREKAAAMGASHIHLSLSHTDDHSFAVVILEAP